MTNSIWKYQLENIDFQAVEMPIGAKILSVQTQNNTICIWAMVDPNEENKENRNIEIFGTGHWIDFNQDVQRNFLGTCQLDDGLLVLHVFEFILP